MSNFEELQRRLEAGETILMDGGMGSEFDRRGLASPTTWSGGPMLTHPELVRDIHQDYIEAGAEIIITNTFGTGRDALEHGGLEHKVAEANRLGIEAAVQARRNTGTEDSVVIAASVSTMAPKAHAEVPVPYEKALETCREQLGELAKRRPGRGGGRDVGPDIRHAGGDRSGNGVGSPGVGRTLPGPGWRRALSGHPGQAWRRDPSGRHGRHQGQGHRIGIHNAHVGGRHGARAGDSQEELVGTFGAYAHFPRPGGPTSTGNALAPQQYLEYAKGWSEQGALIIGGCCGTRPDHIRALREWLSGS